MRMDLEKFVLEILNSDNPKEKRKSLGIVEFIEHIGMFL